MILIAACERAWIALKADLTLAAVDAAKAEGIDPRPLCTWISKYHSNELEALRSKLGLPLKPTRRTEETPVPSPEKLASMRKALAEFRAKKHATIFVAARAHGLTSTELYRFLQSPEQQPARNPAELPVGGRQAA